MFLNRRQELFREKGPVRGPHKLHVMLVTQNIQSQEIVAKRTTKQNP